MTGKRRTKLIKNVGLAVAAILLLVLAYVYTGGFRFGGAKNRYYGTYPNVAGLNIGTPVLVKGVTVGSVADMELSKGKGVKVVLDIDKAVAIPVGSVAWLEPGGINGGQGIEITLGKGPAMLSAGATLETQRDTGFIDNLNYKSGVYLRSGRQMLTVFDTTIKKFNYILSASLLHDILSGVFYLDKNTGRFVAMSGDLKGYSIKIDKGLIEIDTNTAALAAKNGSINSSIHKADTTMAGLANKHFKEDIDTLKRNIGNIAASVHKLRDNKLLNDKGAYSTTNSAIDTARQGITDVKEHPSAHWISVFGKNKKK